MQCKNCTLEDKLGMYNGLTSNAPVSLWLYQHGYEDVLNSHASKIKSGQIKQGQDYKPASDRIGYELHSGGGYALRVETDKNGTLSKVSVFDYGKEELFEYSPDELKELASVVKKAYSRQDRTSISSLVRNVTRKLTKSDDLKDKKLGLLTVGYKGYKAYFFYTVEDKDNYSVKKQPDDKTKTGGRDEIRKSIHEMQQGKIEDEKPKYRAVEDAVREGRAELIANLSKAVVVDPRDSMSYSYINSGLIVVEVEQKQESKLRFAMVTDAFKNDLYRMINSYKPEKTRQLEERQRMQSLLSA